MSSKSVGAPLTPAKLFQTYQCEVSMAIAGKPDSLADFKQLLEPDGDHYNFMLDRLVKLPAFVEEGVAIDHPRSRERWASLLWNTLNPHIKVTRMIETTHADEQYAHIQCRLQMEVIAPTILQSGEQLVFALGHELATYFSDCRLLTVWKLTDEWGDVIYGVGKNPQLIQEQVEVHEGLHVMFAKQELLISEIADA